MIIEGYIIESLSEEMINDFPCFSHHSQMNVRFRVVVSHQTWEKTIGYFEIVIISKEVEEDER